MRAIMLVAVITLAVPIREDPTPRLEKPPHEQILGDWRIDSGPNDGVLRVLRFTATDMLILVDGKPWPHDAYSGPYVADWSKNPPNVDLTRTQNKGILKLEGDKLLVCMAFGNNRPVDFTNSQHPALLRLSRMK